MSDRTFDRFCAFGIGSLTWGLGVSLVALLVGHRTYQMPTGLVIGLAPMLAVMVVVMGYLTVRIWRGDR